MNITCTNPDCGKTHPMNEWTLIRLVMKVTGFERGWDKTIGIVNGLNDKEFALSRLACPICRKQQSVALHPQYADLVRRVEEAGLAADSLFAKVERVLSFDGE